MTVLGKAGRADTATDPAPPSMFETTIILERDKRRWRQVPVPRFYDVLPDALQAPLRKLWPDTRPMTIEASGLENVSMSCSMATTCRTARTSRDSTK